MQITLAGTAYPLAIPSGMARLDMRLAFPGTEPEDRLRLLRWAFGVVGLCWTSKKHGWPDLSAVKHDLLAFGEHVFNGLEAAGLLKGEDDAAAVSNAAFEILASILPTAAQVDEARDFSGAPSGKTSGEGARPL